MHLIVGDFVISMYDIEFLGDSKIVYTLVIVFVD